MTRAFYHIYLSPRSGVTDADVEKKMNNALSWFRYDSANWIVCSTVTAGHWNVRLRPLIEPGGRLLVCELEVANRSGWMPKSLWTWIRQWE